MLELFLFLQCYDNGSYECYGNGNEFVRVCAYVYAFVCGSVVVSTSARLGMPHL